jgi:protocatechuate 3,4-dioxygenase beta subunit
MQRKLHRLAFATALLLATAPAVFAADLDPQSPAAGRIAGRVVDEKGSPVEGASVEAMLSGFVVEHGESHPPGTWVRASTDAGGYFTLEDLRTGWYEIKAWAPGLSGEMVRWRAEAGRTVEGLEIVVVEGAFVEGRVLDAKGRPVAGAQAGYATTDAEGRFRTALSPGSPRLEVSHPEKGWAVVEIPYEKGTRRLDVRLPRSIPVRGRILLPDGSPITPEMGYQISARFWSAPGSIPVDGHGRFRVAVPRGRHEIRLSGESRDMPLEPSWPEARLSFEATEKPLDLEIRLPEWSTVSGRVSGLLPGESALVEIDGFAWPPDRGVPGEDGRYQLARLSPGTWKIKAWTQYRAMVQTIEVGPETRHELDFAFAPVVLVSGRVFDEGGPVGPVKLSFLEGDRVFTVTSSFDGSFLAFLEPGKTWMAWAQFPERGDRLTPLVPVTVREEPITGLEIRFAPSVLVSGRILGLEPGEIAHGVGAEGEHPERVRTGTVDQENEFRLLLPPGTWTVRAGRYDRTASALVHIAPGDREVRVDLEFLADR